MQQLYELATDTATEAHLRSLNDQLHISEPCIQAGAQAPNLETQAWGMGHSH